MNKKGFTLVEIMIVVAIIGLLAAIGIPSIIGAYATAQEKTKLRNIAEVNKAKAVLTLPAGTIVGAMDAEESTAIDSGAGFTNLLAALKITDVSALTVSGTTIQLGATVGSSTSY